MTTRQRRISSVTAPVAPFVDENAEKKTNDLQVASDFAMELSGAHKSPLRLLLYATFAFFPVLLAIGVQIAMQSRVYPEVEVPHNIPPYLGMAMPVVIFLVFLELFVAWRTKKLTKFYRFSDSISSGFTIAVEAGILSLFKGLFSTVPSAFINTHWSLTGLKDEDTTFFHWIAMFIVVELGYYWAHRMGHEWNFMWAGHNVHHSSDEYNLFTAFRQNFVFGLTSSAFYLPIAFVFPIRLFAMHKAINTLYQFWIHTRFIGKMWKPIELIFNTPSHHRVHHGRNPQYIDKNYGGTLIVFDRLFGTFEEELEDVVYGITHMPDTWNPLVIHTHHWAEMWEVAKLTPGFWRKLRVFIDLGPGYNYFLMNYDSVVNPPPNPTKLTPDTVKKRLVSPPNGQMRFYVAFQYATVVAQNGVVFILSKYMPLWFAILVVSHIILQEVTVSALMDRKGWAAYAECVRTVLSLGLALFSARDVSSSMFTVIAVGSVVYTALSIAWVLFYQRESMANNFDGLPGSNGTGSKNGHGTNGNNGNGVHAADGNHTNGNGSHANGNGTDGNGFNGNGNSHEKTQ